MDTSARAPSICVRTPDGVPIAEEKNGRQGLHVVLAEKRIVLVDLHAIGGNHAGVFLRDPLQLWLHHVAGRAVLHPQVDGDGAGFLLEELREALTVNRFDGHGARVEIGGQDDSERRSGS
jgi:hypothetical protein